jgi:hypothetical protein
LPIIDGENIITATGYDCPLARDITFNSAENRGLGKMSYHAVGYDVISGSPIISLKGHLGSVKNDKFLDIITTNLYYNTVKTLWDLQRTSFNYLSAVDELENSNLKEEILESFDENNDGVLSYDEFGKKGSVTVSGHLMGDMVSAMGKEELGYLKGYYKVMSAGYRYRDKQNNPFDVDILKDRYLTSVCNTAFAISQLEMEKWPRVPFVRFLQMGTVIYGPGFPVSINYPGLYSNALFYADLTQNGGKYAGKLRSHPDPQAISDYISDVANNKIDPLDFVLYLPTGFDTLSGTRIPNVERTDDPLKIFTASFQNGKEIWS